MREDFVAAHRFSLVVARGGSSPDVAHRLLIVVAALVVKHRLSSCGIRTWLLQGMWNPPGPGIEPVSPALAGRFLTTEPPGRSSLCFHLYPSISVFLFDWKAVLRSSQSAAAAFRVTCAQQRCNSLLGVCLVQVCTGFVLFLLYKHLFYTVSSFPRLKGGSGRQMHAAQLCDNQNLAIRSSE